MMVMRHKKAILIAMISGSVATIVLAILFHLRATRINRDREHTNGLYCAESEKDFGPLDAAGPLEFKHTFIITNCSQQTINIKQVRSSCGCAVSSVDKSVLAPGEEARISVTVHWSQRIGRQSATIFVECNMATTPMMPLLLTCTVVKPLQVNTEAIVFGVLGPGQKKVRTVRIVSKSTGYLFKILKVSIPSTNLRVQNIMYDASGAAEIVFEMMGQASPLDEVVPVLIETNLDSCPTLQVTATSRHKGCISVQPNVLVFSFREGNTTESRLITVDTIGDNTRLPVEISCEPPEGITFDTRTTPVSEERTMLTLTVRCNTEPPLSGSGTVRIVKGRAVYELPVLVVHR